MKFMNSLQCALRGVYLAIQGQRNMRIHIAAALFVVTTGIYLNFNYMEWSIVVLTIGVVLGMEIINTSVEEVVNFISPEKSNEARRIKDLAAGAVLVVSIAALIIGLELIITKITA